MNIKQKIKELQEEIEALKKQEQENFNWEEAPVICELNGYRWLLGQEASKAMNWHKANDWCESIGGELPFRNILLECFLNENIRPLFKEDWYWSSTEFDAANAWGQGFGHGYQGIGYKNSSFYVRAVRKVLI